MSSEGTPLDCSTCTFIGCPSRATSNTIYTRWAEVIRGSTSYFIQFSETFRWMTCTYQAYLVPKSPPPPVIPKPPLAPPALNEPYGPLTGPPSPKATWLSSDSGAAWAFCFDSVICFCLGLIFLFFPWISIASGSFSSIFGCDCVSPFDSLASTFCVWDGLAANGTELTNVAPIASPPPPEPQVSPLPRVTNTV